MAAVTLVLPSVLRDAVGTIEIKLRAATLAEAMEEAYRQLPVLRHHLCDERGRFRGHVLCFVNDLNTRGMKSLDVPLSNGDRISILQAVSGG